MAKESLQLAVHFLFHTYLHTKKKLRYVHSYCTSSWLYSQYQNVCSTVLMVWPPAGWTQRSGWPRWRCCCPRAVKRASGWCSTWWGRRDERSPGQSPLASCLLHTVFNRSGKHYWHSVIESCFQMLCADVTVMSRKTSNYYCHYHLHYYSSSAVWNL